jgi:hypothetical protein
MPQIFKALTTSIVWILFINGCISFIASGVARLLGDDPWASLAAWTVSIVSFILAAVAIKVRHLVQ